MSREAELPALVNSAEWSRSAAVGLVEVYFAGCFDSYTSDHTDLSNEGKYSILFLFVPQRRLIQAQVLSYCRTVLAWRIIEKNLYFSPLNKLSFR